MHISEVQIVPVMPREGLVAFASCVVDGWLYLGSIAVYTRPDGSGYRLLFPTKMLTNGKTIQLMHPITKDGELALRTAIVEKMEFLAAKAAAT